MGLYLTGLLLDGERKSVVPMAARPVDNEAEAMRQRLQQCVTISSWADLEVRRRLALRFEKVLTTRASPRRASIRSAWPASTAEHSGAPTTAKSLPAFK
jgi:SRSO17 transposase